MKSSIAASKARQQKVLALGMAPAACWANESSGGPHSRQPHAAMSDSQCPSGPWTGFYAYQQFPGKWRTDLSLTFRHGRMTSAGHDTVGPFVISGHYDTASKECHWTKTYVSSHDVFYQGFREGKGIWGTWEIGELARGGFHIWPLEDDLLTGEADHEEQELPAESPVVAAPRNQ